MATDPLFGNDAAGLVRAALFFGTPILAIGIWVLRLVRSKEAQEINGLGGRVTTIEARQSALEGRFEELGRALTAHQLSTLAAIETAKRDLTADISGLAVLISGLTATVRTSNDLRKILREERGQT